MITLAFILEAFVAASIIYAACNLVSLLYLLRRIAPSHDTPGGQAQAPALHYVASLNGASITTGDCAVAAILRRMGYQIHTETGPTI